MPYRVTKRQREHLAAMRKAKETKRLTGQSPDYPAELPELRRVIEITDYDFGERHYRMELYKTNRIDCYDCYVDGQLWKSRIGWSRVQEWIRKAFPLVKALGDELFGKLSHAYRGEIIEIPMLHDARNQLRRLAILRALQSGETCGQVATRFGMTERNVFKIKRLMTEKNDHQQELF